MATSLAPSSARDEARARLARRAATVRAETLALAAPLSPEDQQAQSMPDASPTKWHLAHTTWFFETFVLAPHVPEFAAFDAGFDYLFNSYYEAVGPRHPRPARGLLTRPGLARVLEWRARTDEALTRFVETASDAAFARAAPMIELGLHHEEQHQELILMDALHLFSLNPLAPAYAPQAASAVASAQGGEPSAWTGFAGGLVEIGHDAARAGAPFAFDNEGPRHRVWLEDYALANRLVTNGEFAEFVVAGGYDDPLLWLADGWEWVRAEGARHPLYWREQDGVWSEFTLRGLLPLDPARPVAHISHYEADAYARFRGARLPTEAEWELAAQSDAVAPILQRGGGTMRGAPPGLPAGRAPAQWSDVHPAAATADGLDQLFGACWQWTSSSYAPYPGFAPAAGAIGEYNGKFMINQYVLRGSSCATPPGHTRASYRNFFPAGARWQFTGIRLAR
jgi:ergothioneine biosynthesis protein EgtB